MIRTIAIALSAVLAAPAGAAAQPGAPGEKTLPRPGVPPRMPAEKISPRPVQPPEQPPMQPPEQPPTAPPAAQSK